MIVRFSPRAAKDLADIGDYIHSRNPLAARRVRDAILEAVEILSRFPYAGRDQTIANVRKLVIRRYPYLVYYTIDPSSDEVSVVAIQHSAREREFSDD